jgi:hypothetical protein
MMGIMAGDLFLESSRICSTLLGQCERFPHMACHECYNIPDVNHAICILIFIVKHQIESKSQIPFEMKSNSSLDLYLNFNPQSAVIQSKYSK